MKNWINNQREKWKSWYITVVSYSTTLHLSDSQYRERCKKAEKMYKNNMDILSELEYILKFYKEQ